jgi:hypothetical protein
MNANITFERYEKLINLIDQHKSSLYRRVYCGQLVHEALSDLREICKCKSLPLADYIFLFDILLLKIDYPIFFGLLKNLVESSSGVECITHYFVKFSKIDLPLLQDLSARNPPRLSWLRNCQHV